MVDSDLPATILPVDGEDAPVILLIEDNPGDAGMLRMAKREALVKPWPRIVHHPTAMAAVRWLSELGPDATLPTLALCDYHLPGMTAPEWLSWLRNSDRFASLPCYILTGSASPDDSRRALEVGANGFLIKPTTWEQWLATAGTVSRLLERHVKSNDMAKRQDQAVLERVCEEITVDCVAILSDSQEQHVVAARNRATARLIKMGWPATRISRVLSRSPRTVQRVRERMAS